MVTRMTEARFEALAMWCRMPGSRALLSNKSYWSSDDERIIGATYYIRKADRFAFVLLARDKHQRYRGFENRGLFVSARGADAAIASRLWELQADTPPEPPPEPDLRPGVDLFAPVRGVKPSPKFKNLRDSRNRSAASEMLREIGRWLPDLDGNLVRDFQTTGFDARTWEVYLFAALTELDLAIDDSAAVPDFRLARGEKKLFIEAVTANPTGNVEFDMKGAPPPPPEDFWRYVEHDMPQKFGSPLLSKLRKRYWERDDVKGHPFVLALADFHAPASMTWSHIALPFYLYGMGVEVRFTPEGKKYGVEKKLGDHIVGDKVVPTNFFAQEDARHISAVLFSNAGTTAKFNRMGVLAGFGDPEVALTRKGGVNDPSPGAFDPIVFDMNVEDPDYRERWSDEIEVYHNPNASIPLERELLPQITHFFLQEGELVWRGPSPRVLFSMTQSLLFTDDDAGDEC